MKRIIMVLPAVAVLIALLAGCTTSIFNKVEPINLSDPNAIAALCGDDADETLEFVAEAADSNPNSGKRKALEKSWGVTDSSDDVALAATVAALEAEAVPCDPSLDGADKVGVENLDGSVTTLPLYGGDPGTTVMLDTTANPNTAPLLDGGLRFTAQTLSWAGLVERVGNQQWYIDGVNARAAQTGFDWDDVLRFASVNAIKGDKIVGFNALAIQVFNRPDLTREQVWDEVRKYITPEIEAIIQTPVEELKIQYINNGFTNTMNVGTSQNPKMGDYFDTQRMVRVSLMPFLFDEAGQPTQLDGSRGAGVFIDCANLHWVPKAMWVCTDSSCTPPPKPPVTPTCTVNCNPPVCTVDCNPGCVENCNPPCTYQCDAKDPNDSVDPPPGWVPLGPGELTTDHVSEDQHESGDVSGNVIDNQVSTDEPDVTTPDLPPGTVTAPGATNGGDDISDDVVDETVTNQDDGGTNGDTEIATPAD